MAPSQRPPWWPLFVWAERKVGRPLEQATRTDEFAQLVTTLKNLENALRNRYLTATADALHRANLPAWSDLQQIQDQLIELERKVGDLSMDLERRRRRSDRAPAAVNDDRLAGDVARRV